MGSEFCRYGYLTDADSQHVTQIFGILDPDIIHRLGTAPASRLFHRYGEDQDWKDKEKDMRTARERRDVKAIGYFGWRTDFQRVLQNTIMGVSTICIGLRPCGNRDTRHRAEHALRRASHRFKPETSVPGIRISQADKCPRDTFGRLSVVGYVQWFRDRCEDAAAWIFPEKRSAENGADLRNTVLVRASSAISHAAAHPDVGGRGWSIAVLCEVPWDRGLLDPLQVPA